jgi:F0F1-type ATP synthase membrane subunit b/b'
MKNFDQIKEVMEAAQADVEKFVEKGNKAAGTRVRQAMQEIKKLAQQVRLDVQESKNNS